MELRSTCACLEVQAHKIQVSQYVVFPGSSSYPLSMRHRRVHRPQTYVRSEAAAGCSAEHPACRRGPGEASLCLSLKFGDYINVLRGSGTVIWSLDREVQAVIENKKTYIPIFKKNKIQVKVVALAHAEV